MKIFNKQYDYGDGMDGEVIDICNAMNAMPGIVTRDSCCGHGKSVFSIFFSIKPNTRNEGLFFLTRCTDRRYWKFGHEWNIVLSVSDVMEEGYILPTTFRLESKEWGQPAYDQAEDLIRNMNYHLNHKGFIKGYELDIDKFDI